MRVMSTSKTAVHVRAGALGLHHALGNLLAHGRHGHDFAGHCRSRRAERAEHRRRLRRRALRRPERAAAATAGRGCGTRCGTPAGCSSMNFRMSSLVMRPPEAGARQPAQVDVVLLAPVGAPAATSAPAPRLRLLRLREFDALAVARAAGCVGLAVRGFLPFARRCRRSSSAAAAVARAAAGAGRWRRSGLRRELAACAASVLADHPHHAVHLHRGAFGHFDFLQHAGRRARESPRPPCRWRSRTAARRAGPARRASSATW